MNMFKLSDKVVYVGPAPGTPLVNNGNYDIIGFDLVKDGPVYCVEAITCGGLGLRLVGSTVIAKRTGHEVGWCYRGFRKVEEVREENRRKIEQETTI